MGLCSVPGIHEVCKVAGGTTKAVAGSAFQGVVDAFAKGLADIMKALMTFWIHTPEPDVSSGSAVITTLDNLTRPLVAFAALLGLLVGGVRLVWTARHEQPAQAIFRGLFLMAAVSAAGATIVELLLTGFDTLARAILEEGFNGKPVGAQLTALGTLPGVAGGLVFILAFFGMIASLVQVGIMLLRGGILAVLVGILPVAAAASITEAGFSWFKRLCGWIFSFVLYKLTAAIIYAAAFALLGDSTDLAGIVSGYSLIIVAVLALPALLRLLPPSAEAMGGRGGWDLLNTGADTATGSVALFGRGGRSVPGVATATPGLKGPSGASGLGGGGSGGGRALGGAAMASTAGRSGASAGGASAGGAAAGGAGAGPIGPAVMVAQQARSAAKSAANEAMGESPA